MTWSTCCRVKGLFAPVSEPRLMVKLDWWQRCRYHPCVKGHVGQCRGQAVLRTRNWHKVDFLQWVGPPMPLESWYRRWIKERMAMHPNPCGHDEQRQA